MALKNALITLVLLMKNEAKSIESLIRSAAPAIDSVDLLDTGSTDGTLRIARETCYSLKIPFRIYEEQFVDFAANRNNAFKHAAPHAVFALQLSGDELVVGAEHLRFLCEAEVDKKERGHNCFAMEIDYGNFVDKSLRIVRLDSDWKWIGETHEYLGSETDFAGPTIPRSQSYIKHDLGDPEARRSRQYLDLKILAEKHREDPQNSRTVFYLARTLQSLGFYADAIRFYVARAEMGGWEEEKYVALYQAGRCAKSAGRPWTEVQDLLLRATEKRPTRAEALVALAEYCYERNEHALTFMYAARAASLRLPEYDGLNVHKEVYDWRALNLVHLSGFKAGELDLGLAATRILIEKFPEEKGFQKNLQIYVALIEARAGKPLDTSVFDVPE